METILFYLKNTPEAFNNVFFLLLFCYLKEFSIKIDFVLQV